MGGEGDDLVEKKVEDSEEKKRQGFIYGHGVRRMQG